MVTQTEKYINRAVAKAKKELAGTSISKCKFTMTMDSTIAMEALVEAIQQQAVANTQLSSAMVTLADKVTGVDACCVKVVQGEH